MDASAGYHINDVANGGCGALEPRTAKITLSFMHAASGCSDPGAGPRRFEVAVLGPTCAEHNLEPSGGRNGELHSSSPSCERIGANFEGKKTPNLPFGWYSWGNHILCRQFYVAVLWAPGRHQNGELEYSLPPWR